MFPPEGCNIANVFNPNDCVRTWWAYKLLIKPVQYFKRAYVKRRVGDCNIPIPTCLVDTIGVRNVRTCVGTQVPVMIHSDES